MVKKFFCHEIFWNLWRIDTLELSIQYVKFHCPALPCCRETLPQSFENSAKGGPQANFLLRSKFKFFPKPSHLMANFLYISYLKTVLCCCVRFSHSALFNTGHFWAKKHAIQHGQKIFSVMKSCETYGGLTPRTVNSVCKVSLSCAALLPRNAASKFWKFSKESTPGKFFARFKI